MQICKQKVGKTTFQTLQNSYGSKIKIYDTIIPQGVKAVEGTMVGKSLFAYDKNSKPAIAYDNFCKEVLKIENKELEMKLPTLDDIFEPVQRKKTF